VADFSDIPAEAVEAAARAAFLRQTDFDHLSDPGKDAERFQARRMLSAALPVLNTAKDAETARVDELDRWLNAGDVAGYASVEDLLNAMRVRRNWLAQGVPAVGPREIRVAIAAELETIAADDTGWAIGSYLRKRAASLRGEQ
jgi:hypothetical protein